MSEPANDCRLRDQCRQCPWRDIDTMPAYAVDAARAGHRGWVCHTRCGPCDGPSHAGFAPDDPDLIETAHDN